MKRGINSVSARLILSHGQDRRIDFDAGHPAQNRTRHAVLDTLSATSSFGGTNICAGLRFHSRGEAA